MCNSPVALLQGGACGAPRDEGGEQLVTGGVDGHACHAPTMPICLHCGVPLRECSGAWRHLPDGGLATMRCLHCGHLESRWPSRRACPVCAEVRGWVTDHVATPVMSEVARRA